MVNDVRVKNHDDHGVSFMKKTFLFYDIETSGLNKCFDQVLQFAAIRTDENFNEISRINRRIKLNPDTIPHPSAMLACDVTISDIVDGEWEFDVIREIHHEFNTPGTISIGYNTLGFDDEFLRFTFYRNLLTPYTHQYKDQCQRWDIFPMMPVFYLFHRDILTWPEVDGKISFKLELLNQYNQLSHGRAHDALVDVEATVALAKKLRACEKQWEYLTGYFDKGTTMSRWSGISQDKCGVLFTAKAGFANQFQFPVYNLGMHKHYTNACCWLRLDGVEFSELDVEGFNQSVWVQNIKLNEPQFIFPMLERFSIYLTPDRLEQVERNRDFLRNNPTVLNAIRTYYCEFKYPFIENVDIDAALYQRGFFDNQQLQQCAQFSASTSVDEMVDTMLTIHDPGIQAMAARVIGRIHDDVLIERAPLSYDNFQRYLQRVYTQDGNQALIDYRGQRRLTLSDVDNEISRIVNEGQCDQRQHEILDSLREYCSAIHV